MGAELTRVTKSFDRYPALRGVSLEVADGEFVAVLGPSGCGKTTLLRILGGFEEPSGGEVTIDGRVVAGGGRMTPPEQRNLGMVFQSFALWPHLDVAGHVRFPLRHHRFGDQGARRDRQGKRQRETRIAEVLATTGLTELAGRKPHQLSGGQRQRVALARAIATRPALLLMDEPLSSLDAALREEMRREIQDLHRATGACVVYVTHDQDEALAMADRVVVMREGLVEQVGTPAEIYQRPRTTFVARFVGKATLVEGAWDGTTFTPSVGTSPVRWDGSEVAPAFREAGVFPVRPDELELTGPTPEAAAIDGAAPGGAAPDGAIPSVVQNALFYGREAQYVLTVGAGAGSEDDGDRSDGARSDGVETWRAWGPAGFSPGDRVWVSRVAAVGTRPRTR